MLKGKALVAVCLGLGLLGTAREMRGNDLYFGLWNTNTNNRIDRFDLDTGFFTAIVAGRNEVLGPTGIAVDVPHGHVYFASVNGGGRIEQMNLDGGARVTLVSGLGHPMDVALNVARGEMYWSDNDTGKIMRAALNGTGVQTLAGNASPVYGSGLAVDLATGRVYWSDFASDVIGSVKPDGTDLQTFATPGGGAIDITVDPVNRKLIWSDFDTHKIYRSNMDGTEKSIIITDVNLPGSLAVNQFGGQLYWVDWGTHKIRRSDLLGRNIVDVFASPDITSFSGLAFLPEPSAMLAIGVGVVLLARRSRKP